VSLAESKRGRAQAGFTLIELMIASAIGLIVMTGLTSVVFTTYQANQIAISRVQASSIVGIFQATAQDDFAMSSPPATSGGCGSLNKPCTTETIQLTGCAMTSSGAPQSLKVTYAWDSGTKLVNRAVNGASVNPAATGVTAFSWYVDGAAPSQSVVVTIRATVGAYNQTQTFRFYPQVVAGLPANVSAPC
jgi:prepilin-type N-terminal cleavage/methylation domain-containing protein